MEFNSHLEYCIHTWGLSGGKELKGIEILQQKAMRSIENTNSRANTNVLFYKYKTLMVMDLNVIYVILCRCVLYKKQEYMISLSYNLKLTRKLSLRSFPTLVFLRVWNALTLESKRSESLSLFKKNNIK